MLIEQHDASAGAYEMVRGPSAEHPSPDHSDIVLSAHECELLHGWLVSWPWNVHVQRPPRNARKRQVRRFHPGNPPRNAPVWRSPGAGRLLEPQLQGWPGGNRPAGRDPQLSDGAGYRFRRNGGGVKFAII